MQDIEHERSDTVQQIASVQDHMPEGYTAIFEAKQRKGKSLAEVMWAYDAWLTEQRTVHSTMMLGFPHEPLVPADIRLGDGRFKGGHIVADELNLFFDCRASMSDANKQKGALLLQTKKQGCNLTGTTHDLRYLDLRIREHHDYLINTRVYPAYPGVPDYITMEIMNGPEQDHFYRKITLPCRAYLGLYDTGNVFDVELLSWPKPKTCRGGHY